MEHNWEFIMTTPDTFVDGEYPFWIKWHIRKCSLCGKENYQEDTKPSYTTSIFVGGGKCSGEYPIKVRIIN